MSDDLVKRLRADDQLPFCPYDRHSPEYWAAPDDKPCRVCGTENEPNKPDKCNGTGSRIMAEAADRIEALEREAAEALALVEPCSSLKHMALGYFRGMQAEERATAAEASLSEMTKRVEAIGEIAKVRERFPVCSGGLADTFATALDRIATIANEATEKAK